MGKFTSGMKQNTSKEGKRRDLTIVWMTFIDKSCLFLPFIWLFISLSAESSSDVFCINRVLCENTWANVTFNSFFFNVYFGNDFPHILFFLSICLSVALFSINLSFYVILYHLYLQKWYCLYFSYIYINVTCVCVRSWVWVRAWGWEPLPLYLWIVSWSYIFLCPCWLRFDILFEALRCSPLKPEVNLRII